MTQPILLIINSGSSSVKFQAFAHNGELKSLANGKIYNLGTEPAFTACNETLPTAKVTKNVPKECDHVQALNLIFAWLKQQNKEWILSGVAHRVVHGGTLFTKSVLVTPEILVQLNQFIPLAPLHQPHNLAAIEIINKLEPEIPQIACFDTAFHAHHSPLFNTYALPETLRDQGIRRYGFHGLSYEWIAYTLKQNNSEFADKRVIAAHLGNGASLCAIDKGISIDTTMGLTALDGLPMGTRCGSLDPGAIIYMIRELGLSASEVERILYNDSGLLGLSGLTNDVKKLGELHSKKTEFALDYFSIKTAQFIAVMAISLGGIDALVFTGGIGENSDLIRTKILNRLQCLLPFSVLIIPANEEQMMAMHALALLKTKM